MPYTVKPGDTLWAVWTRSGGNMSWTDFKALNAHLGNLDLIYPGDTIKLPGDAPAAAPGGPSAPSAPAPTTPSAPSDTEMFLEPGAWLALQEEQMELERQWREEQAEIDRIVAENQARALELQLANSPVDFVAYQTYLREREAAGLPTYSGESAADADIQAMVSDWWGGGVGQGVSGQGVAATAGSGGGLGTGQFGTTIPRTEAISRAESLDMSPDEMDILSSFLRAGFESGGQNITYNPQDYWREVEEGFVPIFQGPTRTRYSF